MQNEFNDKWLRWGIPPILALILYSIYVIMSQWAEPENFSLYSFFLEIISLYIYYEASRFSIIFIETKWENLNPKLSLLFQFCLTWFLSAIIGLIIYIIFKQLMIIYQPQNDVITIYHLSSRLLGISIGVIIVFSINFGLNYLKKWSAEKIREEQVRREKVESQFLLLKSQVDPHFLFNSFNTLHSLIHKQPIQAEEFLVNLSQIMRYSLNFTNTEVISIPEEIEILKSYIFIQKRRFGKAFSFQIENKASLIEDLYLLPMSLLMLVENAVKHNEISDEFPLNITLTIWPEQITIKNNFNRKKDSSHHGTGLKNLKDRYSFFSDKNIIVKQNKDFFEVSIPTLSLEKV